MKSVIFGQVRHLLTAAGGSFVAGGAITGGDWETVVGALMIGLGMLWSFAEKKFSGGK